MRKFAELLDQAVSHIEHLRRGLSDASDADHAEEAELSANR
ncbi:hypothetical protein [Streptomyces gilvosporeus]|nr:hypothetical protein [Streptomyces gilvosporeus]